MLSRYLVDSLRTKYLHLAVAAQISAGSPQLIRQCMKAVRGGENL